MLSNSSWSVDMGFDGTSFTVTGMRVWPITIFLGIWLCGWCAGELAAARSLASSSTPLLGSLFILVWLAGWTIGGAVAWSVFLYSIAGREVITVGPGRLRLRWAVYSLRWTRDFAAEDIRGLRVMQKDPQASGRSSALAMAALCFDPH